MSSEMITMVAYFPHRKICKSCPQVTPQSAPLFCLPPDVLWTSSRRTKGPFRGVGSSSNLTFQRFWKTGLSVAKNVVLSKIS